MSGGSRFVAIASVQSSVRMFSMLSGFAFNLSNTIDMFHPGPRPHFFPMEIGGGARGCADILCPWGKLSKYILIHGMRVS